MILTGDNPRTAAAIASAAGIPDWHAGLLRLVAGGESPHVTKQPCFAHEELVQLTAFGRGLLRLSVEDEGAKASEEVQAVQDAVTRRDDALQGRALEKQDHLFDTIFRQFADSNFVLVPNVLDTPFVHSAQYLTGTQPWEIRRGLRALLPRQWTNGALGAAASELDVLHEDSSNTAPVSP